MLCMGRGTVRRTVEGHCTTAAQNLPPHRIKIPENIHGPDPQHAIPLRLQPAIAPGIMRNLLGGIMAAAIHLDRQPR